MLRNLLVTCKALYEFSWTFGDMDHFEDLASYSEIPLCDFSTLRSALDLRKDSLENLDINSLDNFVNSDQVTGEHI